MRIFILLHIAVLVFLSNKVYGQSLDWNVQSSRSGLIEVSSRISNQEDRSGKKIQVIEYRATTTTKASLIECIDLMNDVSKHKEFLERTEVSEKVKILSEDEWVIYYYFTSPWPLPDGDGVIEMKRTGTDDGKNVTYKGVAKPDLLGDKGVKRLTLNDITYIFSKVDQEYVEITMISKFSPVISAPQWMVNTWFPEGPARILERFIKLAENHGE